jgi:predicted ribosome-associated RNA-binding protein Tma20
VLPLITINRAPLAVGTMIIDGKYVEHHGMKGKAVETLHYYRDTLW